MSLSLGFGLGLGMLAPTAARGEAPAAAPVEPGTLDTVVLKNGGLLRGTVVDLQPDIEVTLVVLGTGQSRTVAWGEVDHVELAHPPAVQPPSPAEATDEEDPKLKRLLQANTPGVLRLHIESKDPRVQLFVDTLSGDAMLGTPVCRTPCDALLDARSGASYSFGGLDVPSSSSFQLFDRTGDVGVRVKSGSATLQGLGLIAGITGLSAATAGVAPLIIGLTSSHPELQPNGTTKTVNDESALTVLGGALVGVGIVAGVVGIVLLATSSTSYDFVPSH